jgi:ABC-type anion transport system duplicated permease subunit
MKNCLCPKWIALAVLALTICRLPYKFMEESGAVIWEKQFAFVISDCSRCEGKIKAEQKRSSSTFRKPALQISITEAVPGRSMP